VSLPVSGICAVMVTNWFHSAALATLYTTIFDV
jgi:hypothetical protein